MPLMGGLMGALKIALGTVTVLSLLKTPCMRAWGEPGQIIHRLDTAPCAMQGKVLHNVPINACSHMP